MAMIDNYRNLISCRSSALRVKRIVKLFEHQQVNPRRIADIQGLRAVAALAVVIHHALRAIDNNYSIKPIAHYELGAVGVDLFFVISGFVMVHSSRLLYGKASSSFIFLNRRIARIVPLYWMAMLIHSMVLACQGKWAAFHFGRIAASFFFLPFLDSDGGASPFYIVGWTLNYEMFFYFVFSICLFSSILRSSVYVISILLILVLFGTQIEMPLPIKFWANPIIIEFIGGIIIGLIEVSGIGPFPRAGGCLFISGLLLLVFSEVVGYRSTPPIDLKSTCRFVIWGIPFTLMVVAPILIKSEKSWSPKILLKLGNCSYSIYLVHLVVISCIRPAIPILLSIGMTQIFVAILFIASVLLITFVLSHAIYRRIELPLFDLLSRF